jgi:hypothetical protein
MQVMYKVVLVISRHCLITYISPFCWNIQPSKTRLFSTNRPIGPTVPRFNNGRLNYFLRCIKLSNKYVKIECISGLLRLFRAHEGGEKSDLLHTNLCTQRTADLTKAKSRLGVLESCLGNENNVNEISWHFSVNPHHFDEILKLRESIFFGLKL